MCFVVYCLKDKIVNLVLLVFDFVSVLLMLSVWVLGLVFFKFGFFSEIIVCEI